MKIVLLMLLLLFPVLVRADEPRRVTSFESPNGRYAFWTTPSQRDDMWTLTDVKTKVKLYEVAGDFRSMSVLVGNDGRNLVMIDDYSESEPETDPEVVQFFVDGKKVKSYKLTDLIENMRKVEQTVSHFMWLDKPFLNKNFKISGSQLSLTTIELVSFTFDINSGEITEKQKAAQNKSMVRFDGIYCGPIEDGRSCLRFYQDGTVITVALTGVETDEDLSVRVPKWFDRKSVQLGKYLGVGKYKTGESKISFTTSLDYGKVVKIDYAGTIEDSGDILLLDTYSHYNGNRRSGKRFNFFGTTI